MLLIEGRAAPPAIPGVISGPGNPLLNVYACTGAPGCPQAHVATRALARRLAPALSGGATLHVCGCAKGCAHPGAAALTLVGEPGGTLALIRDGTAADPPRRRGLNPEALVPDTLTEAPDAPQL
jgi:precorrin-3B synthase